MMNIIISVNNKYIDYAKTMLYSLRRFNNEAITVWLLNHSLSMDIVSDLCLYLNKYNINLEIIEIKESICDNMPIVDDNIFSLETYFRLLIPWVLPVDIDRVLWLDADIIVNGDISSFYYTDFNGNCLVACEDARQFVEASRAKDRERLHLDENHRYFNAGVLLMNLPQIRKHIVMNDIIILADRYRTSLIFQDQDLLNRLFQGSVLYKRPQIYNCSRSFYMNEINEKQERVVIIHYYGRNKPWQKWSYIDHDMFYWKIRREQGKRVFIPFLLNAIWKIYKKHQVDKKIFYR